MKNRIGELKMDFCKIKDRKILNPPTDLDDWWNKGVVTTTSPNLRNKNGNAHRNFTVQEEKESLEHLLENGFC